MSLFGNRKSSNPMWRDDVIDGLSGDRAERMTVQGTVNKTLILLAITVVTALVSWQHVLGLGNPKFVLGGLAIGGFIIAMVTMRKPHIAHITAPIYAVIEGLFVGAVSAVFAYLFEGIIFQAISLTFGVLFLMLFVYRSGLIKVTQRFKMIMFSAIGAVALFYLATWIFGDSEALSFRREGGPLAIGISLVIVVIAALSFLLDFDMIEKNVQQGAPKNMEWVGGMALLITIVWLYLELLRLLSYLQD